jgi:Ca2+-binding EF-hand superfamily protein
VAQMQERAEERKTLRFRVMDSDGDGVVSREQFMLQNRLDFADADADDDGKVTEQEFSAWRRGM